MKKKTLLRTVSAALAAVLLIAALTVSSLADHDCPGDDCAVCALIHASCLTVAALVSAALLCRIALPGGGRSLSLRLCPASAQSPVLRRDRLND